MEFGDDDIIVPIIVWTETNYERAVALSEDEMPETFADWQKELAVAKRGLPAGAKIIEIKADPDDVAEWCRRNRGQVTTKDRAAFALYKFQRDYGV